MFKTGIKAIKNLTDYWYHLSNGPNNQVVNKSMKSLEFITASYHRGISYDSSYKVGDFVWIEFGIILNLNCPLNILVLFL